MVYLNSLSIFDSYLSSLLKTSGGCAGELNPVKSVYKTCPDTDRPTPTITTVIIFNPFYHPVLEYIRKTHGPRSMSVLLLEHLPSAVPFLALPRVLQSHK
jgi:hypothetical protein